MRIAALSGLFACATIFALTSTRAGATELKVEEILQNQTPQTSVLELLANVGKTEEPATEEPKNKDEKIVHIVKKNESLSDIAKKHNITWKRLYDKNTQLKNPDVLTTSMKLVVPKASEKLVSRELPAIPKPQPRAARTTTASTTSRSSSTAISTGYVAPRGGTSGNLYGAGYCTWYVKNRRPDLPNNLGNAYAWVTNARSQGMATGSTPRVGAAAQRNNHVAYVEKVNGDGTITISDMNYRALYSITTRTVPANEWKYIY